jgi:SAM-dependent methyltransferase
VSARSRYRHTRTLGQSTRRYEPSLFDGPYLNQNHRDIEKLVARVPGTLQPADQFKLYEMAYFAAGPVLEVGCGLGKSLAILALAVRDSGSGVPIYSIEIKRLRIRTAKRHLRKLGVRKLVKVLHGDSEQRIRGLDVCFGLVFLDGDHSYRGVRRDLAALDGRVDQGGSVMLHDYFDYRNSDPSFAEYGVVAAAEDLVPALRLSFRGGYGSTALFEQA